MKAILKFLNKIFSSFRKFIDKIIFVPISKIIYFISSKFSKPGKTFENWLSRTNTLLFISLIIAIVIFVVIDQKVLTYSESSAEVITSKQVNVLYDEDNYVVEGIPESVDITLIGNKVDLYIAKQSPVNEVTMDLWGLKPGVHDVDIEYDKITDGIKYNVNPSIATVIIYEKVSASKTLSIDLLNQDALNKTYIIEDVSSDLDSVVIKGANYKVEQVATVKALVDVKSLVKSDGSLSGELDSTITVSSTLKAYDEAGNVVDVEISPSKADVNLLVSSSSKEVPIKVITKGNVMYNMGISNIAINDNENTTVTIYGTDEVLSGIEYIPVEIDVTNLSESTQYKVELTKPTGVKYMSIDSATIDVTLSSDISNLDIEGVSISHINLGNGYGVTPIDVDSITVKVKGVTSIVESVTADDINAYIDLEGLAPGEHEVEINVNGNDSRIEYLSSVLKIKVRIYNK